MRLYHLSRTLWIYRALDYIQNILTCFNTKSCKSCCCTKIAFKIWENVWLDNAEFRIYIWMEHLLWHSIYRYIFEHTLLIFFNHASLWPEFTKQGLSSDQGLRSNLLLFRQTFFCYLQTWFVNKQKEVWRDKRRFELKPGLSSNLALWIRAIVFCITRYEKLYSICIYIYIYVTSSIL